MSGLMPYRRRQSRFERAIESVVILGLVGCALFSAVTMAQGCNDFEPAPATRASRCGR